MNAPTPGALVGRSTPIDQSRWYQVFGFSVRSEVTLPLPVHLQPFPASPAWEIRLAPASCTPPRPEGIVTREVVCTGPCHNGQAVLQVREGAEQAQLWQQGIATFVISSDARLVVVHPDPALASGDARLLPMALLGSVSAFVLHKQGYPCLHASAVAIDGRAVAFLGPNGRGKSTIAAMLVGRGATLITDDALVLRLGGDRVLAGPGLPYMKVWDETAAHVLRLDAELPPLFEGFEKRLFHLGDTFSFADQPIQLVRTYALHRYDPAVAGKAEIECSEVASPLAMRTLLEQVHSRSFLRGASVARLMHGFAGLLETAPMRLLSYPHGLEHQDAIRAAILADLDVSR